MNFLQFTLFMCGQLGVMLLTRFFFQWLIDFCSQSITISSGASISLFSATIVGAALLGFRVFDGVTDPIAGGLADNWVKRGRERRVLLWYTAPIPAIGMALCFVPSIEHSEMVRWGILLSGLFVFFVGYTLYAIPYWSLIGDYAQGDEQRRGKLSTLLGVGLLIATAIGFIITPMMINTYGYMSSALMISVFSIPLMIAPYYASPKIESARSAESSLERDEPQGMSEPMDEGFVDEPQGQLAQLLVALKHRRFLAVICLFAGSQMSFTVMTAAAPFIASDLLGGSKSDVAWILGPLLAVALPSSVLITILARKIGWERSVAIACLALGCVYLGAGGLGGSVVYSPMVTASLLFALGGPMVAVLLGLEGEAITACAEENGGGIGMYFGVYNLIVKGANGVAIAVTGILADLARGGDPWMVKLMGMSAGGMLLLGLISYAALKPSKAKVL